jgi:hypothetical protein
MSRADQIRAKGRRVYAPAVESAPSGVVAPVVRVKPVRMTLDLSPEFHKQCARWCTKTAADLDRANLPAVEVVRLLLGRLLADDGEGSLQCSVIEDLRQERR